MGTRTRRICLAALLTMGIVVLLLGLVHIASPPELSYQGKTLGEWIVPFCRQTSVGLNAPAGPQHFEELQPTRRAVSQIGTNALPYLIAALNRREPTLHRAIRQLADKQPYAALKLTDPRVLRIRAIRAMAILGPEARPAIPSLTAQLSDPFLSEHAAYALSGMGADGMRALVDQFTNAAPAARMQIATTLMSPNSVYRGENATSAATNPIPAPLLIEGLCLIARDPTSPFCVFAIQYLGTFGPAASNAVPALLAVLENPNPMWRRVAIRALGQIKAQPDLVIPALTNFLSHPDFGTRMAAVSALHEVGYEARFPRHMPGSAGMPLRPYEPGPPTVFSPGDRSASADRK